MVRNKKRPFRRRSSRSPTRKTVTCDSQIASRRGDPADSNISGISPELQTTGQGQLGLPDRVYLLASVIFQNTHLEKPDGLCLVNYGKERTLPLPDGENKEMHHRAYELAFNALKYQELLENILIGSCFYPTQLVSEDQMSLVAVMLYDFQDRKFLLRARQDKQEVIQEVRDVENYLLRFKTKIAASLARFRIQHNLLSIDSILPKTVKTKQERSASLPLYAWVNTLRSSRDEVQCVLKSAGFSQVTSIGQLEGQTFCQDPHCGDLLVLPAQMKAHLHSTKLLGSHKLIIQDKSCSLGPNAMCSLLPEEGDILMVGCFSGLTVSHTASLIAEKHIANTNSLPTVYACVSDRTHGQREELQQTVTAMGCKNVQLISEDFQALHCGDKRLQCVRAILLTPKCSLSALCNPVEFILQENGDTNLLQGLSQASVSQSKLEALAARQRKDIDHALKFPQVLAVVYSTCSSHPEENEEVVNGALEQAKANSEKQGEPKQANFRLCPFSFSSPDHSECPFFTLEPSKKNNGCFLAALTREQPEPVVKEAPHKVHHRANAEGILENKVSNQQLTRKDQHGHSKQKKRQTRTTQPHPSVSTRSKHQETKGSSSATQYGPQRQSSPGKVKAPCIQNSKNTVSRSFSSSTQESIISIAPKKSIDPAVKSRTPTSNLHPDPPRPPPNPPVPVTSAVRPSRAHHQEVLKPVVLHLPAVNFPNGFLPQPGRTEAGPNFNKWRSPNQTVPLYRSSLANDAVARSRPLTYIHK